MAPQDDAAYSTFQSTLRNALLTSGVGVTVIGFAQSSQVCSALARLILLVVGASILAFSVSVGLVAADDFRGRVPERWILMTRLYAGMTALMALSWALTKVL